MMKLVKTLALIVDVVFTPVRVLGALEMLIGIYVIYDEYDREMFIDGVKTLFANAKLNFVMAPRILHEIWTSGNVKFESF